MGHRSIKKDRIFTRDQLKQGSVLNIHSVLVLVCSLRMESKTLRCNIGSTAALHCTGANTDLLTHAHLLFPTLKGYFVHAHGSWKMARV